MKAFGKLFTYLVFLLTGFFLVIWLAFPWGGMGNYALSVLSKRAADAGISVSYGEVSTSGRLRPEILVENVDFTTFAGEGSLVDLRVRPALISSLLNGEMSAILSWSRGRLTLPDGSVSNVKDGSCIFGLRGKILRLSRVAFQGDISASGNLAVDSGIGRIRSANMEITVPRKMDGLLSSIGRMLPLTKIRSGQWLLKREEK